MVGCEAKWVHEWMIMEAIIFLDEKKIWFLDQELGLGFGENSNSFRKTNGLGYCDRYVQKYS